MGAGVYDRLREFGLGHIIREAKGSFKSDDESKYANKRAQMYFTLRDKFKYLCIAPNEKLKKQLQMISYFFDKKERYLIVPKDMIKKEFGVSPDYADALAMCFFDEYATVDTKINEYEYDDNLW